MRKDFETKEEVSGWWVCIAEREGTTKARGVDEPRVRRCVCVRFNVVKCRGEVDERKLLTLVFSCLVCCA